MIVCIALDWSVIYDCKLLSWNIYKYRSQIMMKMAKTLKISPGKIQMGERGLELGPML